MFFLTCYWFHFQLFKIQYREFTLLRMSFYLIPNVLSMIFINNNSIG